MKRKEKGEPKKKTHKLTVTIGLHAGERNEINITMKLTLEMALIMIQMKICMQEVRTFLIETLLDECNHLRFVLEKQKPLHKK